MYVYVYQTFGIKTSKFGTSVFTMLKICILQLFFFSYFNSKLTYLRIKPNCNSTTLLPMSSKNLSHKNNFYNILKCKNYLSNDYQFIVRNFILFCKSNKDKTRYKLCVWFHHQRKRSKLCGGSTIVDTKLQFQKFNT